MHYLKFISAFLWGVVLGMIICSSLFEDLGIFDILLSMVSVLMLIISMKK